MRPAGSVAGNGRSRLFLALRLPETARDELEAWGIRRLRACRLLPREHLHVTLAFLGCRPAEAARLAAGALDEVASVSEPFPLDLLGWRETAHAGMIVLDDPTGRAALLATRLQGLIEDAGIYRREQRPWLPHVTVARFRARPGLDPLPLPLRTFVPSDAAAYLSETHPSGSRYTVLHTSPLGARDTDRGSSTRTSTTTAPQGG